MSTKKHKSNPKLTLKGKIILGILLGLVLALLALMGIGALNAVTVHVRRAEVVVRDLPQAFDGTTILYAADIDLCGLNTPARAADLFRRLQSLNPDMLLLGGDYTSSGLFSVLNRTTDPEAQARDRAEFIQSLESFHAPLGKYAIRTVDDQDPDALSAALASAGILPLFDRTAVVTRDNAGIQLAGLTGAASALPEVAGSVKANTCVIAMLAEPAQIPQAMINEANGGGAWCDMILTGGTHGGQIRLFGRDALSLGETAQNYREGWRVENGIPILTTSGVGCEGINIRLGTQAEVWVITMRRE